MVCLPVVQDDGMFVTGSLHAIDNMRMLGTNGSIFAIGDCTATSYAPTAQVASQQGAYIARVFAQLAKRDALAERLAMLEAHATNHDDAPGAAEAAHGAHAKDETSAEIESLKKQLAKADRIRPFHYSHQGSLAYIGSEKAIADLPFLNGNLATGGVATVRTMHSSARNV